MSNPFKVVADFEQALCDYTGARFAVTTTSCTMALLLAVRWHLRDKIHNPLHPAWHPHRIEIPKRTYVGVGMSIIHAGGKPTFRDEFWTGAYQLKPLPVWDSARRFRKYMMLHWQPGDMVCVSFHWSKVLGLSQGGAILLDNREAYDWLREARSDGRPAEVDYARFQPRMVGWHAYLSPEVAAHGIMKLTTIDPHAPDLPNSDYPDLSTMEIFR